MKGLPPDPRFPDRPTHPDLRLLNDLVIGADLELELLGIHSEDIARRYIDPESLRYVARHRARGGIEAMPGPLKRTRPDIKRHAEALAAAGWFDGFLAGAAFVTKQGVTGGSSDEEDDEETEGGAG